MEPKEFDIEFPRGDTFPLYFELTDKNGDELDFNVPNTTLYFTMKRNYNVSQYIVQKTNKMANLNKIYIEGKKCSLVIAHNDTAELPYGTYVYDIQIKSGDYVKTLVKGTITLTNESTWKSNE